MNKLAGFSLLELMITVAIVAILASIAYPSYRAQVMRSHRSEAQNALLQVQVAQEKFFLQHGKYASSNAELSNAPDHATPGLGIPASTQHGFYTLTLTGTPTTYTATATAAGKQADDTDCKSFAITHTGTRSSKNNANAASSGCWK